MKTANLLPVLSMCLSYKHFTSKGTLVQTQVYQQNRYIK